jgi:hypothetical protein
MMNKIIFPRAFAFAVDDLGWNEGRDLSEDVPPGPYRTGGDRKFSLKDYGYMIEVGKAVGARIQCLFILSEMDRENILARFPTTTYLREKWNNSFRVNNEQRVIMNYVRDQSAYMEFGLHGTGHEYWAPGEPQKRAEWYNLIDKKPWPEQSLREHIQCFKEIMSQYGFTPANGHSFPESFVPCAYSYYWNPNGTYSLGKLLTEAGVKYANTDFSQIPELNPPSDINGGDFDFGTHVINRINYGNVWHEYASLPRVPIEHQQTDIIESHWPNWLAEDEAHQADVTVAWIQYYKAVQRKADRYVAKNTEQLHSQWLYNCYTKISETNTGKVEIDNTQMPDQAYHDSLIGNMVLKLKLDKGQHVTSASLGSATMACYYEDEGYAFIYLPVLRKEHYTLYYSISNEMISPCVFNDGTYNVYSFKLNMKSIMIDLKVYGTQHIRVKCNKPESVTSTHQSLVVQKFSYDSTTQELNILVNATNMQGSRGDILIHF